MEENNQISNSPTNVNVPQINTEQSTVQNPQPVTEISNPPNNQVVEKNNLNETHPYLEQKKSGKNTIFFLGIIFFVVSLAVTLYFLFFKDTIGSLLNR